MDLQPWQGRNRLREILSQDQEKINRSLYHLKLRPQTPFPLAARPCQYKSKLCLHFNANGKYRIEGCKVQCKSVSFECCWPVLRISIMWLSSIQLRSLASNTFLDVLFGSTIHCHTLRRTHHCSIHKFLWTVYIFLCLEFEN